MPRCVGRRHLVKKVLSKSRKESVGLWERLSWLVGRVQSICGKVSAGAKEPVCKPLR